MGGGADRRFRLLIRVAPAIRFHKHLHSLLHFAQHEEKRRRCRETVSNVARAQFTVSLPDTGMIATLSTECRGLFPRLQTLVPGPPDTHTKKKNSKIVGVFSFSRRARRQHRQSSCSRTSLLCKFSMEFPEIFPGFFQSTSFPEIFSNTDQ